MKIPLVIITVFVLITSNCFAENYEWDPLKTVEVAAPEGKCQTYDGHYEQSTLMQIKANNKVFLQNEAKACPVLGECKVRQKAYLVSGDVVFVSAKKSGFRCAYYGTSKGTVISGYLPTSNLSESKDDRIAITTEFLKGKWVNEVSDLAFTNQKAGEMNLKGHAQWSDGDNVHEGQVDANAKINGNIIFFREGSDEETDCTVRVSRRGPYLILSDNSLCGGMNVRFSGIYIKQKK